MTKQKISVEKLPNEMSMVERIKSPVPPFFKKLRTFGIILTAIGGVFVTPIADMNLLFADIGGYMLMGGAVLTAICQSTVNVSNP